MKLEIASRPPSLRPFSNIFSLGPQTSSAIRKLAGSRHLPFSSCSHRRNNYAARSVQACFLKIYSSVRPTREHEHAYASLEGGQILLSRGLRISLEWRSLFPTTGQTKIPTFVWIILRNVVARVNNFRFVFPRTPRLGEKFSNLAPTFR